MKTSVIAIIAIVVIIILGAGIYALTLSTTTTTPVVTTSSSSSTTPTTSSTISSTTSSSTSVSISSTGLVTTTNGTATGSPYNIGIMEDETGAVAGFANESIHMAAIAVNQINLAGGVSGHPLRLFVANEIPSASAAANTLVFQDNISALVGITYSGDAVSLFPFLSAHHIITIMTTASDNNLLSNVQTNYSGYQYFFRITQTDTRYSQSVVNFSSTVIKPTSIYFVAEDLGFAHEIFTNISSMAAAANIKIAGSTFVPLSQTNFDTTVSAVVAANPDMVIDAQTGSGSGSFIQALKANPQASHIKILYMCNGALADPGFQGYLMNVLVKDRTLLNGVVFQIEASTATKPLNNVSAWLATQYQQEMGPFYPYYSFVSNDYTAVQVLAVALKQSGSFSDTGSIIKALETASYTGPTGTVHFDSQHTWSPDLWYTQFQNGKEQVIYPSAYATSTYNATA